ncbi:unnamed protein product [Leptidea sinapis]|uniref:Uncharacterized protein n=1 Tax=Leptidea sinapis TaxID=189913 RepID=A0A5E4PLL5_9NEOP|nr:unnamed protein product [Leptidea sinapis]
MRYLLYDATVVCGQVAGEPVRPFLNKCFMKCSNATFVADYDEDKPNCDIPDTVTDNPPDYNEETTVA